MNPLSAPRPPKLFYQLADLLHQRNYAPALVQAYMDWVRRHIFFNDKRHPSELGTDEANRFLNYLAGMDRPRGFNKRMQAARFGSCTRGTWDSR